MRIIRYAAAAILVLPLFALPGVASADPPDTFTVRGSSTETSIRTADCGRNPSICIPCVPPDAVYEETVALTETLHATLFPDGTGSLHMIVQADFQEVPVSDLSLPTYTGHAVEGGHVAANQPMTTATFSLPFTLIFQGSDGSHQTLHLIVHMTIHDITADGDGTFTAIFTHGHNTQRCDGDVNHVRA